MMDKKEITDDEWETSSENEELFKGTGMAFPEADQATMESILEQPVMVKDYALREAELGEFAIMLVREKESQNDWSVSCGGKVVLNWLKALKKKDAFPVIAVFIRLNSKTHPNFSYYVPMSTSKFRDWKKKESAK